MPLALPDLGGFTKERVQASDNTCPTAVAIKCNRMVDELHYPPGAEPEKPAAEEQPKVDPPKEEEPEIPADQPKEEEKPAPEKDKEPSDPITKKRSIYDDYKDKKAEARTEKERADAAEAQVEELKALLDTKDEAKTPTEKKQAANDIKEYAEKHKLDPDAMQELRDLIIKDVPKPEMPAGLKPEEIDEWRASRATAKQEAEDRVILAESSTVKSQLKINDDAELAKVMAEIVKLAHTKEFHDKEIEYIVWKNQDKLSKLVSPKRPSFESGGQHGEGEADADIDFSSGKVTPRQAQAAMEQHQRPANSIKRVQ